MPNNEKNFSFCPCVSECGGCSAFKSSLSEYRFFKRQEIETVLKNLSVKAPLKETIYLNAGTRRRVSFALMWKKNVRRFGLNALKSHQIVEINDCPQLSDPLRGIIEKTRLFLKQSDLSFPKKEGTGDIAFLSATSGLDMLLTLPFKPDLIWRENLADFAQKNGIIRVSWRQRVFDAPEPIVVIAKPFVRFANTEVFLPAEAFLQPSQEGQDILTQTVLNIVGNKPKNVVDLFCGAGTFSLPLLCKKRKIKAFDNASASLKALSTASGGRIETQERDLFRMPLWTDEFVGVDAVVIDPPRAGAQAQCFQLAQSDVPVIAYVSCFPKTFVRDANILIAGGYDLKDIQPIDQFVYSKHTELVACFKKR